MSTGWSASPECFFQPCKATTGEMAPMGPESSNLVVGTCYCSHCQHTHLSKPCSGILALFIIININYQDPKGYHANVQLLII